jgi:hypothetical protein
LQRILEHLSSMDANVELQRTRNAAAGRSL